MKQINSHTFRRFVMIALLSAGLTGLGSLVKIKKEIRLTSLPRYHYTTGFPFKVSYENCVEYRFHQPSCETSTGSLVWVTLLNYVTVFLGVTSIWYTYKHLLKKP